MNLGSPPPYAYLITAGEATVANYPEQKIKILDTLSRAAKDGVEIIQIREKRLPARLLFDLVRSAVAGFRGTPTKFLVNGRADISIAAGAHGVHLPSDSISPAVVRFFAPHDFIIGVSAHTMDEAKAARDEAADFLTFGPVFRAPGKPPPVGCGMLRKICEAVPDFPVLGLGGVNTSNIGSVLGAGAAGAAAIRAFLDENSRREMIDQLRRGKRD